MAYLVHYDRQTAPKLGMVMNAVDVFSKRAKEHVERRLAGLFEKLRAEGAIHASSILAPRIFGPHEALAVADRLAAERVDVIMIANSAFPNGHVFPTIALHPHLSRTPVILTAEPEPDLGDREWTTNAWCGVIMNNYAAKQLGRTVRPLAGDLESESYQDELKMLLNAYRAVALLRRDFLGRFGDAPGGFHSATIDQMAFLRTFGTRLDSVDLLGLITTYKTGRAQGFCGEADFAESDIAGTAAEMESGRRCLIADEQLHKGARLYHAFKAQIEANGYTSIAIRCWPEILHPSIGIAPCLAMTWLLTKRVVTAAACESDCAVAVVQTLGTLLSGKPAACLDFVNYPGHCGCVELGHCGVGIAGQMADEAIAEKSPDRQGGDLNAPALIGQFEYGPKTGLALAPANEACFRMLCFTGESSPDSNQRKLYSAADVIIPEFRELGGMILRLGFPHHLAVAMSDIAREVKEVCNFLGVEYVNPKESGR